MIHDTTRWENHNFSKEKIIIEIQKNEKYQRTGPNDFSSRYSQNCTEICCTKIENDDRLNEQRFKVHHSINKRLNDEEIG